MRTIVGIVALEGRHIAVAAAVDQEVAIGYDGRPGEGNVLSVGRSDGRHCGQREPVRAEPRRAVKRDHRAENVGLDRCELVEVGGMSHPLAAARVADD